MMLQDNCRSGQQGDKAQHASKVGATNLAALRQKDMLQLYGRKTSCAVTPGTRIRVLLIFGHIQGVAPYVLASSMTYGSRSFSAILPDTSSRPPPESSEQN